MKARYLFLPLLCTVLIFQCTKDKIELPYECINYEKLTNGYGQPIFFTQNPRYEMAYFNPNNSDEIIYRYADGTSNKFDLIKFNLKTKEKETIYQGFFSNRPRWGKNGWILLNINDSLGYNIYKVRDNGSELTPLTTSGNCFNPKWDINSEKFIFKFAFTTPTKNILMNEYGVFLDTLLCGGSVGGSWQHPKYIAGSHFAGMAVIDPINCETKYSYSREGIAQSLNGAEWLDEERIFWCHTTGIYLTNIVTQETETIRETCNARCYQRPTYAPDIDKIIVEKLERIKKEDEETGIIKVTLVMMNPDGTEEEIIELD